MNYSGYIMEISNHINNGHQYFPTNTHILLEGLRNAIVREDANPEQQAQLIELERELATLDTSYPPSFPGSTAR